MNDAFNSGHGSPEFEGTWDLPKDQWTAEEFPLWRSETGLSADHFLTADSLGREIRRACALSINS
jgi:hypothetical protein